MNLTLFLLGLVVGHVLARHAPGWWEAQRRKRITACEWCGQPIQHRVSVKRADGVWHYFHHAQCGKKWVDWKMAGT